MLVLAPKPWVRRSVQSQISLAGDRALARRQRRQRFRFPEQLFTETSCEVVEARAVKVAGLDDRIGELAHVADRGVERGEVLERGLRRFSLQLARLDPGGRRFDEGDVGPAALGRCGLGFSGAGLIDCSSHCCSPTTFLAGRRTTPLTAWRRWRPMRHVRDGAEQAVRPGADRHHAGQQCCGREGRGESGDTHHKTSVRTSAAVALAPSNRGGRDGR